MNHRKRLAGLARITTFITALNALACIAFAQGSLTPPGAPAPTMKTLAQIEARTPISSVPFTINQSGSYYLTNNVSVSSGDAITIAVSHVTLDLNGFTVGSTQPTASTACGILLGSGLRNIRIANGFIESGVTNNGAYVYSGSGFGYGICYSGTGPKNVLVSGIGVSGCLNHGIYIGGGASLVVESCVVQTVGGSGIVASTVRSSSAFDCGESGVLGELVSDCRAQAGNGTGVSGITVLNCWGASAMGIGLYAESTAQNCWGHSGAGGHGVFATNAQNCYGDSFSGYGVYAQDTASGCVGRAFSGTGLSAYIANSCRGTASSFTGTPQAITFKYNMP
jgi:hypothetical protein